MKKEKRRRNDMVVKGGEDGRNDLDGSWRLQAGLWRLENLDNHLQ